MDRALVEDHLRKARAHVALGQHHIEKQKTIIAEFERDGHDTTRALQLLDTFEQSQMQHVAGQARLELALAALDRPGR